MAESLIGRRIRLTGDFWDGTGRTPRVGEIHVVTLDVRDNPDHMSDVHIAGSDGFSWAVWLDESDLMGAVLIEEES